METLVQQDSSGSISTTWSSFRTSPESVPVSPEYTLVNQGDVSGTSALTKFYADIVESTYQTNLVDYFENPQVQDNVAQQVIPTATNYNTIYRRVDFNIDNMKVYVPITSNANLPMYIAFRGTQTIYDYYRDLNVVLDYGSSSVLGSFNSEMTSIYNTIKTFIETENRPVTILGHSLGAHYALNLLHVLHTQEAPNLDHIESQFKLIMFNPLILVNDAVSYFRASEQQLYSKNNIEIHSIRGDFLSPLLIQAGIGKVYAYDNDTVQTIDTTDFLLGTWLTQLLGQTDRNSYLNDDNHKLSTFGGNTNGLENYKLIDSINNDNQILASIRNHNKMYVRLLPGGSLSEVYTFVWDNTSNANQDKTYIDYPHESSTHDSHSLDNYNWYINRFSESSGYKYQNIISTYNNQKYINFRRYINSEVANSATRFRYLVKVGDSVTNGEFVLMLDSSTVYKQGLSDIISDAGVELLTPNISTYFTALNASPLIQTDIDKYLVDIVLPQADAGYVSNRRSTIPSPMGLFNTYLGSSAVRVKISMVVDSTYAPVGNNATYFLGQAEMPPEGPWSHQKDYAWHTSHTGSGSIPTGIHGTDWTSDSATVWDLSIESTPTYFDSNYPEHAIIYNLYNNGNNKSLGENFNGYISDDNIYLEDITPSTYPDHTRQVYIKWVHPTSGVFYFLSIVDGQGTDPDSTGLYVGGYAQVKWLPENDYPSNNHINGVNNKWHISDSS